MGSVLVFHSFNYCSLEYFEKRELTPMAPIRLRLQLLRDKQDSPPPLALRGAGSLLLREPDNEVPLLQSRELFKFSL